MKEYQQIITSADKNEHLPELNKMEKKGHWETQQSAIDVQYHWKLQIPEIEAEKTEAQTFFCFWNCDVCQLENILLCCIF